MQLISVNIGQSKTQTVAGKPETTGIYKTSTSQPVLITSHGLQGDFICDTKNHGGPDQAVYVYGAGDYAWWSDQLERKLEPGTFGENLTISQLESADFMIGDRLHIGEVILQVTAPRIPCGTLAARMGDPKFVKKYRQAVRPGLYCRVIRPGSLQVGAEVTIEKYIGDSLTIAEMFREYYVKDKSSELIRRMLTAPIAIRARNDLETETKTRSGQ